MNDPRSGTDGGRPDGGTPRARDGARLRLEHESTLSLDWETQHGSGGEAARVDEALRARDALRDEQADGPEDAGPEPDIGLDRTIADPANATMRGIESPLIAPKGASGGAASADGARASPRPSDEGFRFTGASMSFGQLVVVESRDVQTDGFEQMTEEATDETTDDAGGPADARAHNAHGAAIMLVVLGVALALAGALLLVL